MTMTVLNTKGIPMSDDALHQAAHNMDNYGGGFASAIATAYFRADSNNKARLLLAFGDLFALHAPESDETTLEVVKQIKDRVNGPFYSLGWDIIAETVDTATLQHWVETYGTLAATWEALATAYNLPQALDGAWMVRTSDVDGARVTQHATLSEALDRYSEMSGRTVSDDTIAELENGDRDSLGTTSDFGTRVNLARI